MKTVRERLALTQVMLQLTAALWEGKLRRRTSNLQLALHLVLPEIVDGPAGVSAPVKQARLANIQSQHALVVLHQELGVLTDDHVVLHPNDLWLRNGELEEEAKLAGWRRRERRRREHIRARDVGRVGEQREEGEVKLGQHFGLTNLCRFSGIKRKKRKKEKSAFKDRSAPPLVLASDIKIHSCCKGIKILSDCSTLTV